MPKNVLRYYHNVEILPALLNLGDPCVREVEAGEVEKFITIFTYPGLDVVAGNVVPGDTVVVEVIEDSDASFVGSGFGEFSVIGLWGVSTTSGGPISSPSEG